MQIVKTKKKSPNKIYLLRQSCETNNAVDKYLKLAF